MELLRTVSEKATGAAAKAISAACDEVEEEEDEHLYHTTGWTRELWMEALGLPAVVPPPEEQKGVKTAIGAARAKNARRHGQVGLTSSGAASGSATRGRDSECDGRDLRPCAAALRRRRRATLIGSGQAGWAITAPSQACTRQLQGRSRFDHPAPCCCKVRRCRIHDGSTSPTRTGKER